MHFCVALPDGGHLIVNWNVTESTPGPSGQRRPRLIVLAWSGAWTGNIVDFKDGEVQGAAGRLDARWGSNTLAWRGEKFDLRLQTESVACDLRLRPAMMPSIPSTISLGAERSIRWVVVPRLHARGTVRVGSRTHALRDALAYHDHNWGSFAWGDDLSWEWGFVRPREDDNPLDVVVFRVSDGSRFRTLNQAVLVWRDGRLWRAYHNRDLQFSLEGARRDLDPYTLPPIAKSLVPRMNAGVPQMLRVRAQSGDDALSIEFRVGNVARLALPSEADPLKLVTLNETCGSARVYGRVESRDLEFDGDALLEFVRG